MTESKDETAPAAKRRRAIRTAALLAIVALAFYVGIFLLVKWRHP